MVKKKPKSRAVVSSSFGVSSLRPNSRMQLLVVALFAFVAGALIYRSFANPVYSTSPNDVILQYIQPHNDVTQENRLSEAHYSPFTLYGNGLLVCGQSDEHQFDAPNVSAEGDTHEIATKQPTARTLSKDEVSKLIQSVRDTGFEQLDPEYYELPVSQNQYTVHLALKGGEKNVLYYNDVAPPAAYSQTLTIMKDACASTTQPFISDTATVRARVDVDATGKDVEALDAYDQDSATSLKGVMNQGKALKRQNDAKRAANQQVTDTDEQATVVSGATAQSLQKSNNGKASKFITLDGENYEVSVDPELPKVNNPLNIDYNKVRQETEKKRADAGKSALARTLEALDPSQKADAATNTGYRVVLLLPSSGGSTGKSDEAQNYAAILNRWGLNEVGKSPTYKGFSVIRGSQTQAYYNACHTSTCYGNQLFNILYNVAYKDPNTIYRGDVATIIVPGWKTNTLSTSGKKACGWGFQPGYLSAVDLYQTDAINGYSCKPLNKLYAHEYSHNVGLGHNANCTAHNLMDGPPGCKYTNDCGLLGTANPLCTLNSTQDSYLRTSTRY